MSSQRWRIGSQLRVRGRRWQVRDVASSGDCCALTLAEIGSQQAALTILTPFDRPIPIDARLTPRVVRPRRWLHELDRALVEAHPFDGLAATAHSRIRLFPYQLEPALAMLRDGAARVLIGDAVGLGKTIQAGVILLELSTASSGVRALVLTPAGLREQWSNELGSHFGLSSVVADAVWLRRHAAELPSDVNPWSLPGTYVASHDFVKRPEALRPLEDVTWDLVIVDEAHAATAGTDRRAAIHAIASRSLRLVLLTATPHTGSVADFSSLCDIGRVQANEPPPVFFSRSKLDVHPGVPRRSIVLGIALSAAEREMHRLLDAYSSRIWNEAEARGDDRARLASIVLRKRALSSAGSLVSSVERRLALLASGARPDSLQLSLPLDDEDPLEDEEPLDVLGAPGLADATREKRWLSTILQAAREAARDETKVRALRRLLRRVREPVIVFTEYRDTLARLQRIIGADGRSVAVLHGGMGPVERARIPALLGDRAHTLLATDAAAEGLNLHHHCRIVIHYELPWNGARLEQRAGRVDRIGQNKRVHEIALVAAATPERLVLAPLLARARGLRTSYRMLELIGESRVAASIIAGAPAPSVEPSNVDPTAMNLVEADHRAAAVREAARLEHCRSLVQRSGTTIARPGCDGPVVSVVRRAPRNVASVWAGGRLALIYLATIETDDGRTIHAEPLTIAVDGAFQSCRSADLRILIGRFIIPEEPRIVSLLGAHSAQVHARVVPMITHVGERIREREDAIVRQTKSAARDIVQPRLFGRRAMRDESSPREHTALSSPVSRALAVNIRLLAAFLHCTASRTR